MKLPEKSRPPENLEIPGLYPPRRRLPRWPLGLWLVVLAVVAIPAIGLPGIVLARYTTSDSSFCLSCHATGETPDRSVTSQVHPDLSEVSCVDCHARPGQVVFEGYVKGFMAEPERVSGNCVRCHPATPERTGVEGFKFNENGIQVNHQAHLERGATCVSCHANVAHDLGSPKLNGPTLELVSDARPAPEGQGSGAPPLEQVRSNRPTMESCYSCHSRSTSCAQCHAGALPQAQTGLETAGRRPVEVPAAAPAAQAGPPADSGSPLDARSVEEGKALYSKQCASCHGADGNALPSADLSKLEYLTAYGPDALARTTAEGKGGMPPLGTVKGGPLEGEQIRSIIDYLFATAS